MLFGLSIAAASALVSSAALRPAVSLELVRAQPVVMNTLLSVPPGGGCSVFDGFDGGDNGPGGRGGGGGGGGGDDGDASEFLRLLNAAEQSSVLDDWVMRSRIYKMTDNTELKTMHHEHVDELEWLREFNTSESGPRGRRMMLGLFRDGEVRALCGAEVSHASGLVVSSLNIYPAELNDVDSTTSLRMVHALHLLADAIETPLDLSAIRESGKATSWLEQIVREGLDEEC